MRDTLRALWEEILDVQVVDDDTDFLESGGTSLDAVNLAAKLQERLGLAIDALEIVTTPTFGAQVVLFAERAEGR